MKFYLMETWCNWHTYIDFYNNDKNLLIATYDGVFAYANLNDLKKFKKLDSNKNLLIKYDKFYFHQQYGIKDILIDKNKLFVSYIGKQDEKCYDLKIISSELNEKFLQFEKFYQTSNCVSENNSHGFWAHQGAGGRMINVDNSSYYLPQAILEIDLFHKMSKVILEKF